MKTMTDFNILPASDRNNIAIVFSANDFFLPYHAVMIQSILDNASPENTYDILIFHKNIPEIRQKRIELLAQNISNAKIRFVSVEKYLCGIDFYTANRSDITEETYFRLFTPFILNNYTKILYLDGDMLARADVADLYNTDISDVFLASTRDYPGLYTLFSDTGSALRLYRHDQLGIDVPEDYFLAGMLLLNLKMLRENTTVSQIKELVLSQNWRCHDQDILNMLCWKKVLFVDPAWDATEPWGELPEPYRNQQYQANQHPKIIHFAAGQKPWLHRGVMWENLFWQAAVKSPFFPDILDNQLRTLDSLPRDEVLTEFSNGYLGFRYIWRYFKAWLKYKITKK